MSFDLRRRLVALPILVAWLLAACGSAATLERPTGGGGAERRTERDPGGLPGRPDR